ncbi:MAG: hypothetical protein ACI8W3_002910 [Myxococcota bacterium]|jgi:hypothetical protein
MDCEIDMKSNTETAPSTPAPAQTQTTSKHESPDWTSRLILGFVIAALYPRMFYGFSFFDEAYYIALPYSFSLGYRPFFDEGALPQLAGLMTQPFFELYLKLVGSNSGLVLFARHLYFVTALATAWVVRSYWLRISGERVANLLAAAMFAYVPFCIFGLSYNTFTSLGFLAGTALLAAACLAGNRPRAYFFATLCMAGLSFAYPPMFAVALLALAYALNRVFALSEASERKPVFIAGLGAGLLSLVVGGGILVVYGLPETFDEILAFSNAQALQGGGGLKWRGIAYEVSYQAPYLLLLGGVLLTITIAVARHSHPLVQAAAGLLVGPVLLYVSAYYKPFHGPYTTAPLVLSCLGLGAPLALGLTRKNFTREQWSGLLIITATGVVAGLGILWSSSNGLRNMSLGLTPAALVTLACLTRNVTADTTVADATVADATSTSSPIAKAMPFTVFMVSLLCFQVQDVWTHAYREAPPLQLQKTVDHGAWKGIKTTSQRATFVHEVNADIARVRGDAKSILFFDYFPAGFLVSDLKPTTSSLWTFPVAKSLQGNVGLREVYADRLVKQNAWPDLVIQMHCIPGFSKLSLLPDDPLLALFTPDTYEEVLQRPCYSVVRRRPEANSGS